MKGFPVFLVTGATGGGALGPPPAFHTLAKDMSVNRDTQSNIDHCRADFVKAVSQTYCEYKPAYKILKVDIRIVPLCNYPQQSSCGSPPPLLGATNALEEPKCVIKVKN